MSKKWTEDELIYLEYCYYDKDEYSIEDIAEFLGRTKQTVHAKASEMRKENKNFGSIKPRYNDDELKRMVSLDSMMTRKEMAEILGRGVPAVHAKLKLMGINKNKKLSDYDKDIRRLASEGKYIAEICRILDLKDNSLHYYLKRHGIECKKAPKEASQKYWRDLEQASLDEFRAKGKKKCQN